MRADALARLFAVRLAAGAQAPNGGPAPRVVWNDGGDELLLHLDSLRTRFSRDALSVGLDVETDQTGRQPVQVVFSLAGDAGQALVAATEELPRGDERVVARWGRALQDALWAVLVGAAQQQAAAQPGARPVMAIERGQIRLARRFDR